MAALLGAHDGIFVWRGGYESRAIPKAAGFMWDRVVPRAWATRDSSRAAKLLEYADGSCRVALAAIATEQVATLEASRATDAAVGVPAPDGLAYMPFQRAGIAFACSRPGILLADEMGLGKTIQVLGLINLHPEWRRVLVICPASLKLNWKREAERWLTEPWAVYVGTSTDCPVTGEWPAGRTMLVLNYDITDRHEAALRAVSWDLLVADEAHFLKSPTARRTMMVLGADERTVKRAQKNGSTTAKGREKIEPIPAKCRAYLTGTPIVNRPIELWPLVHSLAPDKFGSFWAYARRYCGAYQGRYGWDLGGASNLPELQEVLRSSIMVRRLKAEVLTDLLAKRRQVVDLVPNGAQAAISAEQAAWARHQDAIEGARAQVELAKASEDPADYKAAVDRLHEAARVSFAEISRLRHETALAKVPGILAYLKDQAEAGAGKIVIFAHHHDVQDALMDEFGETAVLHRGGIDDATRDAAVARFQTDPACRWFVGSIQASGVGITLTASAHVVFAELDWVPGNVTQAEDRCHRIGQRESVIVQHLVLDGSLDARMARTLVEKQEVIDRALDRRDPVVLPALPIEEPATKDVRPDTLAEEAMALTSEQIEVVHLGLRMLAGRCDGAVRLDGAGFNRLDTRIGHALAERASLTPRQAALGRRLARKYRRQLPTEMVSAAGGL